MEFKLKKTTIICIIIALVLILIPCAYLYNGNLGIIAQDSIEQTINGKPKQQHVIKVYSGEELIYEFQGYYTVENYGGYYVILNFVTDEEVLRLNFYGESTITDVPLDEEVNAVSNRAVKEAARS